MLKGPDARTDKFLTDLAMITRRLERAQLQVTSGRKVTKVSDDPDQIAGLLQLRSHLGATEQIRANLWRVKTEVDAGEQALQHAAQLLDRVLVLGTQGASDMKEPAERSNLSREVSSLLEQLVGVAATTSEGRYIFSGDSDQAAPYVADLSQDAAVSVYQGSAATREVQHPSGRRFSIALTAQQIFDDADPANQVFQAVNAVRLALRDNDSQGLSDALGRVRAAATHLNSQLAHYGTTQNQVAEALELSYKQELRLREQISSIEDADLAAAILELNDARFQQETALTAEARRLRTSLFDYLR